MIEAVSTSEEPSRKAAPCHLEIRLKDAHETCGDCGWPAQAHRNHHSFPRLPERDVHDEAIEVFGVEQRVDKVVEELGELTAVLMQRRMGRRTERDVATEIADVRITLVSLERIIGVELVEEAHGRKLARLRAVVERERAKLEQEQVDASIEAEVAGV